MQDKSNKPVGRITVAVKFERPNAGGGGGGDNDAMALVAAGSTSKGGAMVPVNADAPRDPAGKFTDDEILEAFRAFDLDKNNFVGAAEIRHVLINIGAQIIQKKSLICFHCVAARLCVSLYWLLIFIILCHLFHPTPLHIPCRRTSDGRGGGRDDSHGRLRRGRSSK